MEEKVFIGKCKEGDYFEEKVTSEEDLPSYCPNDFTPVQWREATPEEISSGDIDKLPSIGEKEPSTADDQDASGEEAAIHFGAAESDEYELQKNLLKLKYDKAKEKKEKEDIGNEEETRGATPSSLRNKKLHEIMMSKFNKK